MIFIFFHIHSSIFMFTLHYFIMEFIFFSLKWAFIGFGRKTWRKKEKGGREGELRKKGRGKGKEGKREEKRRGGRGKGKNDQSRLNKKQCQKGLKKTQEGPWSWCFKGTKTLHYTTKSQKISSETCKITCFLSCEFEGKIRFWKGGGGQKYGSHT